MKSYCLYHDNIILDISDIFYVVDGKQIYKPEIYNEYKRRSKNKELFCPCGCGENLFMVAGKKQLRRQHFRYRSKFVHINNGYHEESNISIKSKIILKCWLEKNLPNDDKKIEYNIQMDKISDGKRKFRLPLYAPYYKLGIVYEKYDCNFLEDKVEILSQYVSSMIYVTRIENENRTEQYTANMMHIQDIQGFCFYLDITEDSRYEDIQAKIAIYEKNYNETWTTVTVCKGKLDEFEIKQNGNIFFKGNLVEDLVKQKRDIFIEEQNTERERIKKENEEYEKQIEEIKKQEEEKQRKIEEERKLIAEKEEIERQNAIKKKKKQEEERYKEFADKYPKFAVIYNMLSKIKKITGQFWSDQSDGRKKQYTETIFVERVCINIKKHRIEISDRNNRVYLYIEESEFVVSRSPGTGCLYKIINYRRSDLHIVETLFLNEFVCIMKEGFEIEKNISCTIPDIQCINLKNDNICILSGKCTYQGQM